MALHWTWSKILVPFTGKPKSGHDRVLQMWPHWNWKGAATFLKLLATLLLMQPGMWLAFITSRAHCWIMLNNFCTSGPALLAGASSVPCEGHCWRTHNVLLNVMKLLSARKDVQCMLHQQIHQPFSQRKIFSTCLWVLAYWLLLEAYGQETGLHHITSSL